FPNSTISRSICRAERNLRYNYFLSRLSDFVLLSYNGIFEVVSTCVSSRQPPGTAVLFFTVKKDIRIAFFPDSYLEVNGAAMTCQRLVGYAKENGYPFLCVYGGHKTQRSVDGSVTSLELKRSPVSFKLDEDLAYDPLFQRHTRKVMREIAAFKPDVIHITGLNDVSILGSYIGWKLDLPLVGSWHTNLHE